LSKIIFASPTYGAVEPAAIISQRAAIMHAGNYGHHWVGDASPDKCTFTVARGNIAQCAIDSDADYVFWCDSDIVLPQYAITQLLADKQDFVTGIYFQKVGEHWPLIANFDSVGKKYNWMVLWPENVVAPIDGCGFGCVLTSTKMLRDIKAMWEREHPVPQGMTENEIREHANPWFEFAKFSEDFEFCQRAKRAGYQLHVDTAVICGHLPPPPAIGFDHFKAKHPEFFGGKQNGNLKQSNGQAGALVLHSERECGTIQPESMATLPG